MTDTVRAELSQYDGDKIISKVTIEWYDMDRDGANFMSMDLVSGIVTKVDEWRKLKNAGINPVEEGNAELVTKGAIR